VQQRQPNTHRSLLHTAAARNTGHGNGIRRAPSSVAARCVLVSDALKTEVKSILAHVQYLATIVIDWDSMSWRRLLGAAIRRLAAVPLVDSTTAPLPTVYALATLRSADPCDCILFDIPWPFEDSRD
jgi:hypothetical protein